MSDFDQAVEAEALNLVTELGVAAITKAKEAGHQHTKLDAQQAAIDLLKAGLPLVLGDPKYVHLFA